MNGPQQSIHAVAGKAAFDPATCQVTDKTLPVVMNSPKRRSFAEGLRRAAEMLRDSAGEPACESCREWHEHMASQIEREAKSVE